MRRQGQPTRGAALMLAVLAVALVGLASASRLEVGTQVTRREAEDELLLVGADWQRALRSYVGSSSGHAALGPRSLDDLLRDPRFAGTRRHLRQVPIDPMTGATVWGLVRNADGQIVGIHSLSREPIIRRNGFPREWEHFGRAETHQGWVFSGNDATPVKSKRTGEVGEPTQPVPLRPA
jgi:murein DD-endopeptidase MepM/ murein hydrolase activator NlpD